MNLKKYIVLSLILSLSALSLPIDWSGSLGFDTTLLTNARGTNDNCTYVNAGNPGDGSQCVKNDDQRVRFQTMLLKLNPTIIVNDSTSIKGEISTGTTRGIFLGANQNNNNSGAYFSANEGSSTLNINQLYAELYADTAIYKVGKFSKNFGLGAIINSGANSWDRFYSAYNGIEANFRLGNLTFIPTWAKISTGAGSNGISPSGKYDVTETSFEVSYNNAISGIEGGVFYAKRSSNSSEDLYGSNISQNVTLIDVFLKKTWDSFSVALEAPMISGEIGNTYSTSTKQDIDSKSYIIETTYKANNSWSFGFNGGMIGGEDGDNSDFEGMHLHSNYQLANIMFRYDLNGFQNTNKNPLASSVRNATYINFYTQYQTLNWKWKLSYIMATAAETAESGKSFYNHERRIYANQIASEDQDDDLGYEIDFSFDYEWNPQINISGFIGYYSLGDYFAFDNSTSTSITTENITASGVQLSVNF